MHGQAIDAGASPRDHIISSGNLKTSLIAGDLIHSLVNPQYATLSASFMDKVPLDITAQTP